MLTRQISTFTICNGVADAVDLPSERAERPRPRLKIKPEWHEGCSLTNLLGTFRRRVIVKIYLSLLIILTGSWVLGAAEPGKKSGLNRDAAIHGKYIVDHVAMCVHCHTPRDANGQLLLNRYLEGAPVQVPAPAIPRIDWALRAPAIIGLPGYTRGDGIRLLMDGVTPDGRVPRPPMPPFRLSRSDAEAVVTFLQSGP